MLYRLDTTASSPTVSLDKSHFAVSLDNGITSTIVFSATSRTPWNLAWADLAPWAGQTVTVTLATRQVANEPSIRVAVDEIVLSSWATPQLSDVIIDEPDDLATPTTVRIYGSNFLPTSEVWWGDQKATSVTWINSTTLEVAMPTNLGPGLYTVRVVNPGGLEMRLPNALQIGKRLQIPWLLR